jgi:hypothetical protein
MAVHQKGQTSTAEIEAREGLSRTLQLAEAWKTYIVVCVAVYLVATA